jgi:hypothetical protein
MNLLQEKEEEIVPKARSRIWTSVQRWSMRCFIEQEQDGGSRDMLKEGLCPVSTLSGCGGIFALWPLPSN